MGDRPGMFSRRKKNGEKKQKEKNVTGHRPAGGDTHSTQPGSRPRINSKEPGTWDAEKREKKRPIKKTCYNLGPAGGEEKKKKKKNAKSGKGRDSWGKAWPSG